MTTPMFPHVTICGLAELARHRTAGHNHVISIWEAASQPRKKLIISQMESHFPTAKIYPLFFDDTHYMEPRSLDQCRAAIGSILKETAKLKRAHDRLLVHCMAGVSRSTAVAFAVLCQAGGPGSEAAAFHHLRGIRPQLLPNRLITELADKHLNRGGRMLHVVHEYWQSLTLDSPEI